MGLPIIHIAHNGQHRYHIFVGTGTAWVQEFHTVADNITEAIDHVADYCEENAPNLIFDHYALADECDLGQSVEEYAEANGLICCGNHGVYIDLIRVISSNR